MKFLSERERKDRQMMADRIYAAIGDMTICYGFETMMTCVGAALVAANDLDGSPPSPQADMLDTIEQIARAYEDS